MASSWSDPINIGSDEAITANGLAQLVAELRGWPVTICNDPRAVRPASSAAMATCRSPASSWAGSLA